MRVTTLGYGQFLINSPSNFTGTHFADSVPELDHNSVFRFLKFEKLTPRMVREKVESDLIFSEKGIIIFDDTVLDKNFSRVLPIASKQFSGNAHHVVNGVGVINCLYYNPEIDQYWILDYRIYDKSGDGKTKLDHILDMFDQARLKGVPFTTVLMDTWYATTAVMLHIHHANKIYYCPLKSNRKVDDSGETENYKSVDEVKWSEKELLEGKLVHLKGLSEPTKVKLFRVVVSTDRTDYVVTNDLTQNSTDAVQKVTSNRWKIEQFHRELKGLTGIEDCECRLSRSQRNHICVAIMAWIVLKRVAKKNNKTIYQQKREPMLDYLKDQWQNPTTVFC